MGASVPWARWILWTAMVFLASTVPAWALPTATEPTVPVRVAVAAPSADAGRISASGTVQYKREVTLSFKTGGVVQSFAVDAGDPVRAGQALVNADPTDVAGRRGEAEAAFAQAKSNLDRAQELSAKGFASEAKLEDARAVFKRAQAALNSARFDESRAALVSPADGVVLIRHAEVGQQMAPGAPVITIGDAPSGLILVAPISDRQIIRVRTGDAVQVRMAAIGAQILNGRVTRLAAKADRVTGAFDVEIALDAPPAGLRSGLVAQATITPGIADESATLLAIPAIALLEGRGDLAYVYVVGPDEKATRVAITIERFLDDAVLIRQGLKRGDRVVTAGAAYLSNGQKVSVSAGAAP